MHKLTIIFASLLVAACAHSGDAVTWTVAIGTNDYGTAYANPFTGDIDEVTVYAPGNTGAVSIAALDPYSGNALVLCTNAAAAAHTVFTPRVIEAAMGGATELTVTNSPTADRFRAQGERLVFTVGGATATGTVFRCRIKTN